MDHPAIWRPLATVMIYSIVVFKSSALVAMVRAPERTIMIARIGYDATVPVKIYPFG